MWKNKGQANTTPTCCAALGTASLLSWASLFTEEKAVQPCPPPGFLISPDTPFPKQNKKTAETSFETVCHEVGQWHLRSSYPNAPRTYECVKGFPLALIGSHYWHLSELSKKFKKKAGWWDLFQFTFSTSILCVVDVFGLETWRMKYGCIIT